MAIGPAPAGRPRFDIGDIVRQHRAALEAEQALSRPQRRVLSAIAQCRTAALGGHIDQCCSCGHEHPSYNSCRNRHCPKCQALAQQQWIAARSDRLLPVGHFHVVFTLPSPLRALAKARGTEIYNALFAAASQTISELAQSRLGARLGMTLVLHTWTRDLRFHPHLHGIVTAGGLALDGTRWTPSQRNYLFPLKMMGALLRGKMMAALDALHRQHVFDGLEALADPNAFGHLMARLARTNWIVYAKKPFRRVDHVLAYLGRYTHRVAIANSRIVAANDNAVVFRTKDGKTVALPPLVFLSRFVQHVLPDGLHKIRHYGLYSAASARRARALEVARCHLSASQTQTPTCSTAAAEPVLSCAEQLRQLTGRDITRCSLCGGPMISLPVPRPCRAPP